MTSPCFDCPSRGSIPGDAHSRCSKLDGAPTLALLASLSPPGSLAPDVAPRIHPHGWCHGWAAWPLNFDPIWILSCPLKEKQS